MAKAKSNVLMITKKVRMPLIVSMTGSAADLKGAVGDQLVSRLASKLPMKIRLGRGRKESIQIHVKA